VPRNQYAEYSSHSVLLLIVVQRVTFSTVAAEDLKKAGVTRKHLAFEPAKVTKLTKGLTKNAEAEIVDLHCRIKKIYARVNMYMDVLENFAIPRGFGSKSVPRKIVSLWKALGMAKLPGNGGLK